MRIGIEAQRIFRSKKHGMDMVVLEAIKQLQKLDTENDYFIFVNIGEDKCLEETKNFTLVEFGGSYPIWEQIKLPQMAKKYQLDVLHCTSNTAPINCPVPLVLTLHDIIFLEKNNLFTKGFTAYQKFGNIYRKLVVPMILKKCKKIITVSNFEKDRIGNKLHLSNQQLTAVYNGVSQHFQKIDDLNELNRIKEKYKLPDHFLFFLGNTDPKKNTPRLIKAYVQYCLKNEKAFAIVIADFPKELVEAQLAEIGHSELIDKFYFPGYILNAELPGILNMASIVLYPSLRESFGIPILESMACGTPVITSNAASMPEVSGGAAKLIDPTKEEEITNAIEELLSNGDLYETLRKKGVERAQEFSWENTAKDYLKIYNELNPN